MAWYAWSEIRYGAEVEKDTGVILKHKSVKAGESVTAAKLGINEDAFQQLVDAGSVRSYKGPHAEMEKAGVLNDMSPVEYLREKLAAQTEDEYETLAAATVGGGGSYFGPTEEAVLLGEGEETQEEAAK